jgi:hypothetical protein
MSAYTPGPIGPLGPSGQGPQQSGSPGGAPTPGDALLAAKQELGRLRDVFESIHDALVAAVGRVEALELQLGAPPRDDDDGQLGGLKPARTVAEWKMAGWTPATSGAVVTGESLRARREALGISQAAVAHAAHCSRGLVAEVERGKRRSAQTLAHLSNTLDKLEQQARRN